MSDNDVDFGGTPIRLPWGAIRETSGLPNCLNINTNVKSGEYVLQILFADFTTTVEKKIDQLIDGSNKDKPLSKSLQHGEDSGFDQLLSCLNTVAENCLPSLLRHLMAWYDRQNPTDESGNVQHSHSKGCRGEKDYLCEKRDLAVDFIFCLVLIEVLKQLPYHPGHDELMNHIISMAFRHFRYSEGQQQSPNAANINIVADLYAEVIGVLSQTRFLSVKKRFMAELKEYRGKELTPLASRSAVSLLMGLKFFRVKMHPIEDFQACIQFLHDLGGHFLEAKDKDVKHALAGLFVEILLPVAAVAKNEVNVPVLKNFVDLMYTPTLDQCAKKKHTLALFPMATCLLCVSQKQVFLQNWPSFLTSCLSKLKEKDAKMARVALESLYRILWVYMIRIRCESNTVTTSRLQSIVNSLFPKGTKLIVPRDMPLNIFVKIVQFIAQERLDFAMKEIIFDLLCVGKPIKTMFPPERMSIGLRAFLVIADSLQQKEGDPPMPQTATVLPSGSTVRFKKTFINKYLSEQTARNIGIINYYVHVRKSFDGILKQLDVQVGKPMLLVRSENQNREPEELITGDRKPKIDLFRICVAAIPRLLPDGMGQHELISLLTRLTVHMDDELGRLAFQSLQNIIVDLNDWRSDVVHGYLTFVEREVTDSLPQILEQCCRRLNSLLSQWKTVAQTAHYARVKEQADVEEISEQSESDSETVADNPSSASSKRVVYRPEELRNLVVLHEVEGFALLMLCSCKPAIRKLAVIALKEVRQLCTFLRLPVDDEPCVLDELDKCCPLIIDKVLPHLPVQDKQLVAAGSVVDFQWLCDRTCLIWMSSGSSHEMLSDELSSITAIPSVINTNSPNPWRDCLAICLHQRYVGGHCLSAVNHAWPLVITRLNALFVHVDPTLVLSESRTSGILRGAKKVTSQFDTYMSLWKNYVVLACCIAPGHQVVSRGQQQAGDYSTMTEMTLTLVDTNNVLPTARQLFKLLVPLIKCDLTEMQESVVTAVIQINPATFRQFLDELSALVKEAVDRKQENVKRKRKKDTLRLALCKIFHLMAENLLFAEGAADVVDSSSGNFCSSFIEFIDGARQFLECEMDRDSSAVQEMKLHLSEFIRHLIRNIPMAKRTKLFNRNVRFGLFTLFANWSGKFGTAYGAIELRGMRHGEEQVTLELSAVQAMSAVLCCGPVFDPAGLEEGGHIYRWLDTLLSTRIDKIYRLAQETVILLLHFNAEAEALLDWVIDRCYTGSPEVADGCFRALAAVFSEREYPCDHVAMLCVTLMYTGSAHTAVKQTAIQLLHLLYRRFYLDNVLSSISDTTEAKDFETAVGAEQQSAASQEKKLLQEMLLHGADSRSQMFISETLSRLLPDLTMPIFSEVMQRLQTASSAVRQSLLHYVLPWLHNLELVDPNLQLSYSNSSTLQDMYQDYKLPLHGHGWGSQEATEMVLNNLFYVTAKFDEDHCKDIEALWATLVTYWPGNLNVIIRYLIVMTSLAPMSVLSAAKKVVIYLARAKPDRLVEEMMIELQTTEPLGCSLERISTAPFYRLTAVRKSVAVSASDEHTEQLADKVQNLDKGLIHTKRHTGDNSTQDELLQGRTFEVMSSGSSSRLVSVGDESAPKQEHSASESPHPLPMPAYGGYYAPLSNLLSESAMPTPLYQRCYLAVMLLTDLVVDSVPIDWSVHLPIILHIIFIGVDHNRPLLQEHCCQLLVNLLVVLVAHKTDHFALTRTIIYNKDKHQESLLSVSSGNGEKDSSFMEGSWENASTGPSPVPSAHVDMLTYDNISCLPEPSTLESTEQVTRILIEFLVTRKSQPLWQYEDVTAKVHKIKSASDLEHLLKYVARVFRESLPYAHVEQRWAQDALHLALSCSSRHCAGRSFQVFRALHMPLNRTDLADILSRLVETVAEQGEDMQGYVTEIMLTLEAAVDNLDVDLRPLNRDLFMSTPNLVSIAAKKGVIGGTPQRQPTSQPSAHLRSTSYTAAALTSKHAFSSAVSGDVKFKAPTDVDDSRRRSGNFPRSTSANVLKPLQDTTNHEDKLSFLTQMFWIGISLLESDFEYEFLLALKLLDKVLGQLQPDRPEVREKMDKMLQQLKWDHFPGMQALLLKGCTSPVTTEMTLQLLSRLTSTVHAQVIDLTQIDGFPMNVIALLPYLIEHYETPNKMCIDTAVRIAQMCAEISPKLDNLATVMTHYSRGAFGKDSFQWTKCVVKYLYDIYASRNSLFVSFLIEMLEKGPSVYQAPILQILHCVVHYVDVTSLPVESITNDMLRVVARQLEGAQWREAQKIVKLCVTRSSSFSTPSALGSSASAASASTQSSGVSLMSVDTVSHHTSFAEAEISYRKELPGRSVEFAFNLSRVPIIGYKKLDLEYDGLSAANKALSDANDCQMSGWKRPHQSQARTRERLVGLLNCFGHPGRVTMPIRSPSVIFSYESPSDTLERQTSVSVSSDTTSLNDMTGDMRGGEESSDEQRIQAIAAAFDFLEDPDPDPEFLWGVKRHSVTLDVVDEGSRKLKHEESSDEETQSNSPVEEFRPDIPGLPSSSLQAMAAVVDTTLPRLSISSSMHSVHSVHSQCSEVETLTDLSPNAVLPTFSNMAYTSILSDEIEEVWYSHVHRVMTDTGGTHAIDTFHIFTRLFNEARRKQSNLTQEAWYFLSQTASMKDLADQLSAMLDIFSEELECPRVFVDADAVLACNILDEHKFVLLEITEHYDTFMVKKDEASQHVQQVKNAVKQLFLSGESSSTTSTASVASSQSAPVAEMRALPAPLCTDEQMISVAQSIYKLHFQLLQLFETYIKLVSTLQQCFRPPQITDLSAEMVALKTELERAVNEIEQDIDGAVEVLDVGSFERAEAEKLIIDLLDSGSHTRTVQSFRELRSLFRGDMFGIHPTDEVDGLLFLYCRHKADIKPGNICVIQSSQNLSRVRSRLMDINLQIAARSSQPPSGIQSPRLSERRHQPRHLSLRQCDLSTL